MADLFPADFEPVFINIGDLELYNQDLDDEGTPTEAWTTFREEVKQVDGVMFVTPEYNRSVPAVLKNALDVGSRPYGESVWDKKPGLVVMFHQVQLAIWCKPSFKTIISLLKCSNFTTT